MIRPLRAAANVATAPREMQIGCTTSPNTKPATEIFSFANECAMSLFPARDAGRGGRPGVRSERVADRLHSAAIHLLRRLRREDAEGGLSGPELSALSVVVLAGPVGVGELASAEQVSAPTMSRLVRRLERAGMVARRVGTEDRRVVHLEATDQGRRMLAEGRRRRVEALAERLGALPEPDLGVVERAVAILDGILQERPETDSAVKARREATTIDYANFARVELRVGRVLRAERFPEARKPAYRLWIDFGELGEKRSSAQITGYYEPEGLVGRQVIAVTNFPPRQIGPFMSEVLVLGVELAGEIVLLKPDREVAPGSRIY